MMPFFSPASPCLSGLVKIYNVFMMSLFSPVGCESVTHLALSTAFTKNGNMMLFLVLRVRDATGCLPARPPQEDIQHGAGEEAYDQPR
jgi:hypothetical protein